MSQREQNIIVLKAKQNKRKKLKKVKISATWQKKQPKKFWKSIKSKFKAKSPQSESLTAEDLLNHFKIVFAGDTGTPAGPQQAQATQASEPRNNAHPELDAEITEAELKEAVFHQKNNKSPGIDNLNAELFKISLDIISPFLLKLYNRIFQNGEYPRSWGEGIIIPIFKSENVDEAQN